MVPALAADPRVVSREGVNARLLTPDDFPHPFDIIVADLSFISLTLVLPTLAPLLAGAGALVCLVKPQFEVGPARLGKGGVVRDPKAREESGNTGGRGGTRLWPSRIIGEDDQPD